MDHIQFDFNQKNFLKIGNLLLNSFVENIVTNKNEDSINLKTDTNEIITETSKFSTPLILYSKNKLKNNFLAYKNSFEELLTKQHEIETKVSYSLKANFNPSILRIFYELGSWCSLVIIFKLLKIIFNSTIS
jgi:hypothetical protein